MNGNNKKSQTDVMGKMDDKLISDPISAVIAPDPYPYYAELGKQASMPFERSCNLWIAASAALVEAVLADPDCRVRPLDQPVPPAIEGSPAGAVFGRLVRMNDGPERTAVKRAIVWHLARVDMQTTTSLAQAWTRHLMAAAGGLEAVALGDLGFRAPIYTVASLLGAPADALEDVDAWTGRFVKCISPLSSTDEIEMAKHAAASLMSFFDELTMEGTGLAKELVIDADSAGANRQLALANLLGLLSQTYDATAGLVGNILVALGRHPQILRAAIGDSSLLEAIAVETLRHDAPIQNTRRFAAANSEIAGADVKKGDAILVILAGANRDPAVNPDPDDFRPDRQDARIYTFGHGDHRCPGRALAVQIAQGVIGALLAAGLDAGALAERAPNYQRSVNARIPDLGVVGAAIR
ncbi:MAG: cytochrome P450 [Alphaproteobacteria bacterium]|nr:cytochrome P450 [Alphaproteobacteria bacterium]